MHYLDRTNAYGPFNEEVKPIHTQTSKASPTTLEWHWLLMCSTPSEISRLRTSFIHLANTYETLAKWQTLY